MVKTLKITREREIKPDRATMSLVERPTLLKKEMSWFRLEVGGGRLLLAAAWLAVLASLLPSFTYQSGPPSCKMTTNKNIRKGKKKMSISQDKYLMQY
jgi:hypothetical protein